VFSGIAQRPMTLRLLLVVTFALICGLASAAPLVRAAPGEPPAPPMVF